MIIIVCILIWLLCAIIAYAIIKNLDPGEVEGDEAMAMFLCFLIWPALLIWGIGYLIFHKLSAFGEFAAGFIAHLFKKD